LPPETGFPSKVADTVLLLVMLGRLLSQDFAAFSAQSFSESAATFSSQLATPLHLAKESFSLPGQAVRVVFSTHSPAKAGTERHNNRQATKALIVLVTSATKASTFQKRAFMFILEGGPSKLPLGRGCSSLPAFLIAQCEPAPRPLAKNARRAGHPLLMRRESMGQPHTKIIKGGPPSAGFTDLEWRPAFPLGHCRAARSCRRGSGRGRCSVL